MRDPYTRPVIDECMMSVEAVAEALSEEEGRRVTVAEVMRVEAIAMRKLRSVLVRMHLRLSDLAMPDRKKHTW